MPDPTPTASPADQSSAEAAPPEAEATCDVHHLGADLDDARLAAEFGRLSGRTMETITYEATASVEAWATVRFKGESEVTEVRAQRPEVSHVEEQFLAARGGAAAGGEIEIVSLRVRRVGRV